MALSTSFGLHVISLERSINFVYEFRAWNIPVTPSENFQHKKFLSENIMMKNFHANYLELKLTQTKIEQITV